MSEAKRPETRERRFSPLVEACAAGERRLAEALAPDLPSGHAAFVNVAPHDVFRATARGAGGRVRRSFARCALLAAATVLMAACGSDDWPRDAVNLEVDLPPSIDGWEPTSDTECFFGGEPLAFAPLAGGENVLDRGPEAANRDQQELDRSPGVLVGDVCRVTVQFDVTTDASLVVEVSRGGRVVDVLETTSVSEEYHRSGIEWSPGSPWRLGE